MTAEVKVSGRVAHLHRKPRLGRERGLPKQTAPALTITPDGVDGDFNRWRTEEANGDPDQAVLLIREEILTDLRAEGWPVQPGDLGENLTLSNVPADALRPGVEVHLGTVVLEISKPCDPCIVLYGLPYIGIDRGPAFLRALNGRRGWFARVRRGGTVHPDSPVVLRTPNSQ